MLDESSKEKLSPAQTKLLEAIRDAGEAVVVVGERQYTLAGDRQHYATIEALERRGILVRVGGNVTRNAVLVLADGQGEQTNGTDEQVGLEPTGNAPANGTDLVLADDHRTDEQVGADLRDVATRHARLRAADDVGQTDAGARARQRLREDDRGRDDSLLGWLWRRIEGVLS